MTSLTIIGAIGNGSLLFIVSRYFPSRFWLGTAVYIGASQVVRAMVDLTGVMSVVYFVGGLAVYLVLALSQYLLERWR